MATRTAKLLMITPENNNKFYNMVDNGSTISIEFGRVGTSGQTASYPSSKWSSLHASKIKKGYKDVTELFVTEDKKDAVSFLDISDTYISNLIRKLEQYTKHKVANNYNVTADTVTEKQIKEAQNLLNALMQVKSNREMNKVLIELFTVIPRKMKKVADHLFEESDDFVYGNIEETVAKEQDLLDTMSQQVNQTVLVKENKNDNLTILDAMGINIFNIKSDEEKIIKSKLANLSSNYVRGYMIENKNTKKRFDSYVNNSKNKATDLFFHGSRNENWLPILQTGLVLRPTNAVITGKMFGYGTYFADKAQKSWGYTSARGSYWAKGGADEAYMALFDVHVGNKFHLKRHESWMSSLDESKLKNKGQYDSVFAEGGADLRNNEYIVYNEAQTTVKYLIQMKG
jgi:poly [ADP-ribose] polymerase